MEVSIVKIAKTKKETPQEEEKKEDQMDEEIKDVKEAKDEDKKNDSSPEEESKNKVLRIMCEGDYFGEVALVTNLKRTASVKANKLTYCMKLP